MGYTTLRKETLKNIEYDKGSLEFAALTFIRENCEMLRFDEKKNEAGNVDREGTSIKANQIPYNMEKDIDRLCLENAVARFLTSGKKEDAFDVYFCYLEMFVGDYKKTRRMIELLSEFEANGSGLLMKHRDHYSHSVYVFLLGLAIYQSNEIYRRAYRKFYDPNECMDEHEAAAHYLKFWGLTSLFHDIGYPFELPFEQVASYFEVDGIERKKGPFLAYHELAPFVSVDKAIQRRIGELYELDTDKMIRTTDELFAYCLHKKLGKVYYFSEEEMLEFLKKKPTEPNRFGHFMDHAYFSATILFKKLFCELRHELTKEYMDSLTAILLHNSLYKFCVAHYKDKYANIRLKVEWHPLAYMLMLCDELQCWDRTAYGRNSKLELHPMACEFDFSDNTISANYVFDGKENIKISRFEKEMQTWKENGSKKADKPKLKAYASMRLVEEIKRDGDEKKTPVCEFQADIERILDLSSIKLLVHAPKIDELQENRSSKRKTYLSDSNYINLYKFAAVLHGMWENKEKWKQAKEDKALDIFLTDEKRMKQVLESFGKLSLEYKFYNINQAKSFARLLKEIDCFYTDKPVDFEMVDCFSEQELGIIGPLEHQRWLQDHYDMGWTYGEPAKEERELKREHRDMIPGLTQGHVEVSVEQAKHHYETLLDKATQDKDTEPMECMLAMLKMFDGIRIYRLS